MLHVFQCYIKKQRFYNVLSRKYGPKLEGNEGPNINKLRDAKRLSSGRIFLSYPHTHDKFFYHMTSRLGVK